MKLSLFKRDTVARLLNVESKYVYRILTNKGLHGGLIPETAILECLNNCRINMPELENIPQLYTAEEMLNENKDACIDYKQFTVDDIARLGRRKLFPIPHYKIGKKTLRYPKYALSWWVSQICKPLKRRGTYNERTAREAFLKPEERNLYVANDVIKHV